MNNVVVNKLTNLFMLDTDGALSWLHTPSFMSFSRISHANMLGFLILYELIDSMTDMVATFGFEPPMRPGFIEPVELNLKIVISNYI